MCLVDILGRRYLQVGIALPASSGFSRGILLGCVALMLVCGSCWAGEVLEVSAPEESWNLAPYVDYLTERDGVLTLQEVAQGPVAAEFQPLDAPSVNFGLKTAARWYRFALRNTATERESFYVELDNSRLSLVEFFAPGLNSSESRQIVGTSIAFKERSVKHRHAVFSMTLDAGQEVTAYFRVVNDGVSRFSISLWQQRAFGAFDVGRTTSAGAFFGSLLVLALVNGFLFVIFRDRSYVYLVVLISSLLAYFLLLRGYAYQFLWPDSVAYNNRVILVFVTSALIATALFTRDFLDVRVRAPRVNQALLCVVAFDCLTLMNLFGSVQTANTLVYVAALVTSVAMAASGLACLRNQRRHAAIFLSAFLPPVVGSSLTALSGMGLLPKSLVTENGLEIGFPLSLVVFSFAIWDRMKNIEENYRVELETKVEERTHELAEALANVRTLHGFIPICSHCKKVRDDKGYWNQIETYISSRSDADFSHSICPECVEEHYGDIVHKNK